LPRPGSLPPEPFPAFNRFTGMTRSTLKEPRGARLSSAESVTDKPGEPLHRGPAQPYPGAKARQGRIVLNTPWRRTIFIAGLFAAVILALVVAVSV